MASALIADNETLVRLSLQQMLREFADIAAVNEARDGFETLRAVRKLQPSLVIVSSTLLNGGGIQLIRNLQSLSPASKFVVLLDDLGAPDVESLMDSGIDGLLHKRSSRADLQHALRRILNGEKQFTA